LLPARAPGHSVGGVGGEEVGQRRVAGSDSSRRSVVRSDDDKAEAATLSASNIRDCACWSVLDGC
jgi:hypothetical protein